MQKCHPFQRLRQSRFIYTLLALALIQSSIFDPSIADAIAPYCPTFLRFDDKMNPVMEFTKNTAVKTVRGVKTVIQTVRPAQLFYTPPNFEKAEEIYNSIPDNLEARKKWLEDYRDWAALPVSEMKKSGKKLTPEYSLVALRILSPDDGRQIWEMLSDSNLILTRKKFKINPFGLLAKLREERDSDLTPEEKAFMSEIILKSQRLFVNKLIYPERITDMDRHLISLIKQANVIATRQGDPFVAVAKSLNEFLSVKFQSELDSEILHLNYLDEPEGQQASGHKAIDKDSLFPNVKKGLQAAGTVWDATINQKEIMERELLLRFAYSNFLKDVQNPGLIAALKDEVTPIEDRARRRYGPLGLQAAMRRERGYVAGSKQFIKVVIGSSVLRALLIGMAIAYLIRKHLDQKQGGFGSGNLINMKDPNGPAQPVSPKLHLQNAMDIFGASVFNPFDIPGLYDDIPDPQNPSIPPCPCDPEHKIRNKLAAIKKTNHYKNNKELSEQNPEFRAEALAIIEENSKSEKYPDGGDPDSPCGERWIKSWMSSQ